MHVVDFAIFIAYLIAMLGVGVFFLRKNKTTEDYFVGGRKMNSWHIGLSVVATDVGGGFSIGLGGLGFTMGISGSWLLFTGLVGAWLSGVVLIPKIAHLAREKGFITFPQFLAYKYDKRIAFIAGIISTIGYMGFTSSQLLAGAKLASATFPEVSLQSALWIMGAIAVIYTVLGGIKAVIYTDTIQWIVLMSGLILVALPYSLYKTGGLEAIQATLPDSFLSLGSIRWQQIVNWSFTIIPIWFIGMTLYQRIYSAKDAKSAQKAWFIAGLFEYPIMAFMGVMLGMIARVAITNDLIPGYNLANVDAETGLPLLLRNILPVGLLGIVLSAYFSAIMSTADSCLMASSGNLLTDVLKWHKKPNNLRLSQLLTFVIGAVALWLALKMTNVLELMLHSYAFMVSGLLIPVLMALLSKKTNSTAALTSMISGGIVTLALTILKVQLPFGLNPIIFGLITSFTSYLIVFKIVDSTKP